jgi:Ca2+-binding EF-hand superfamily protein
VTIGGCTLAAIVWFAGASLVIPANASAQASTTPGASPGAPTRDSLLDVTIYREAESRALFRACDHDADDRLDLIECSAALPILGNPRDVRGFRRLDTNSDGFVEWHEFDEAYRESVRTLGIFRLRPVRAVVEPEDPTMWTPESEVIAQMIQLVDDDGDGMVSRAELARFAEIAATGPELVRAFEQLDRDGSGALDAEELAAAPPSAAAANQLAQAHASARSHLPPELRLADRNLDGVVDASELESGLRRIHPSLSRWTGRVLADADRNQNGTLGAAEIASAGRTVSEAARENARTRR